MWCYLTASIIADRLAASNPARLKRFGLKLLGRVPEYRLETGLSIKDYLLSTGFALLDPTSTDPHTRKHAKSLAAFIISEIVTRFERVGVVSIEDLTHASSRQWLILGSDEELTSIGLTVTMVSTFIEAWK